MKGPLLLPVLVPTLSGQEPDPCRAVPDPLRRIDCYADRSVAEPRPVWRLGEETDPITDRTSVVLRRRANEPSGRLLRPALTLVCWQGREILLSLEAGEPLAPGGGEGPAEVGLTVRIGTDTPARRAWMASGPPCGSADPGPGPVRGGFRRSTVPLPHGDRRHAHGQLRTGESRRPAATSGTGLRGGLTAGSSSCRSAATAACGLMREVDRWRCDR